MESLDNVEEKEESLAGEWGKDTRITFKPNIRIRVFRIIAVFYVFLNVIIGLLFYSNSLLVNTVIFLYLAPNTLILIHYLKMLRDKTT